MTGEPFWREVLDATAAVLAKIGDKGWLVGGCLRDAIWGSPVRDVDVAIAGDPLAVADALAQRVPLAVGRLGRGTIRLTPRRLPDMHLDLTQLRGETITTDLAGRDFTINALALPLSAREQWLAGDSGNQRALPDLIDPFGGRKDIEGRRLAAVSPDTFRDDPGRIVRAARLAARFGLDYDAQMIERVREAIPLLATLSPDRLRMEVDQLLVAHHAEAGVAHLERLGAFEAIFPGLTEASVTHAMATLREVDHLVDGDFIWARLDALRQWCASDVRRIAVRRAALSHAGDAHLGPEATPTGWQRARDMLAIDDPIERLHAARLLLMHTGRAGEAAAVNAILVATACFSARSHPQARELAQRADTLVGLYTTSCDTLIPPSLVTGSELITALGLSPGPEVGRLLQTIRRAQLADSVTDRASALALARTLLQLPSK
jgi:tRNA nucleotidyltransferase/poly(A) polymerase